MTSTILVGKYFLLINPETHEHVGKARILEHIHDRFYWGHMHEDGVDIDYFAIIDLENIAGIPFFNTLKELENFVALAPKCNHHGPEVSH